MLVRLEDFRTSWSQVVKESLSHSTCRVVIFVACLDVDALCAARMLSTLLKKHLITHKTVPVVGFNSLREAYSRLDDAVRNVFCVGCGATADLDDFLGLDDHNNETQKARIHVFDSHRPWNLNNLYGSDRVFCYDDGYFDQLEPYQEAYEYLATNAIENEDESFDKSSDEGEFESGQEENELPHRKRGRSARAVASDSESDTEDTQPDEDEAEHFNAAKAPQSARKRKTTKNLEFMRLLENYYTRGSHLLSTNAVQMYTLMTMIGETSLHYLWLTLIGVTSMEPQHPQLYSMLLPTLRDEMRRLNEIAVSRDGRNKTTASRRIMINAETDYSLFLLRQWSLYDSMIHSSYVSAKLYLWREDGRKKLHKLLARIGITLEDARQTWIHMKPQLKRELKPKLDSVSGIYGIEGITRPGIVRRFGLDGTLSAGDCAESVAALLEIGDPARYSVNGLKRDTPAEPVVENNDGSTSASSAQDDASSSWAQHFWTAWDSIDNFSRLCAGANQAKLLQRAVVATGNSIFDNNLPKDLHTFRMVIVQEAPELEVFLNPLSLQRLGIWISEGCAEIHTANIPLILALLDEKRDVYLVLGMGRYKPRDDPQESDSIVYNQFGRQFQTTASAVNAKIRVDAFESAIIEVSREDLPRFLEALDSELRGS